jgi:hypothetical protein
MSWASMADRMLGVAVRTFRHADQDGQSRVLYIPRNGNSYYIDAVFDQAHIDIDRETGALVSSTDPVLGVQLSQMQGPIVKGDLVRVGTVAYKVVDFQPDGVAGARLKLHKS